MSRSSKSNFRGGGYSSSGLISELPKMPKGPGPGSSSPPRVNWFRFEILAAYREPNTSEWKDSVPVSVISTDIKNAIEKAKDALDIEDTTGWIFSLQSLSELQ